MNAKLLLCMFLLVTPLVVRAESKSQILILDNENLLEGQVVRTAEGIQIALDQGGEMIVPSKRVLAVVPSRAKAFEVISGRANLRDADERLRLARWCHSNQLLQEALAQAETASRMRPGFVSAERMVQSLKTLVQATPATPAPTTVASNTGSIVQAKAEMKTPVKETVTEVGAIEYNTESFPLFSNKVNAILVNACANCHVRDDIKLKLTRIGGRAGASKNLLASLPFVTPADPLSSPLLVKSVTAHGGALEAPLKTRKHPAYQALETWVRFARSPEGTLEPNGPVEVRAPNPEPNKLPHFDEMPAAPVASGTLTKEDPTVKQAVGFGDEQQPKPAAGKPVGTFGAAPQPKSPSDDPFDPSQFNNSPKK
jgi:hypothetical protein